MKLAGSVKNLKDGTVQIQCKGDEKTISEFRKQIDVKNPKAAQLIEVEKLNEKRLPQGTIQQTTFDAIYDDNATAEIAQGFSTGMNYLNSTKLELSEFRNDTKKSFTDMDKKYDKISQAMFAVVASIEDRNKTFENRMEKTEKNIESLLKVLVQKKG